MSRAADTDHPIHALLAERWSPYGFSDRPVGDDDLRSIFEAARWAPSSYNEQPWRFFLASRSDAEGFERIQSCLVEGNQAWARYAGALALGVALRKHARNDRPNRACEHDLGLAAANLTVEANARGLFVHQMIGIVPDRVRELFSVPEDATPLTGIAIGYADPAAERLDEKLRDRDRRERTRKPLPEIVFGATWGEPSTIATGQS